MTAGARIDREHRAIAAGALGATASAGGRAAGIGEDVRRRARPLSLGASVDLAEVRGNPGAVDVLWRLAAEDYEASAARQLLLDTVGTSTTRPFTVPPARR